MPDLLVRLAVRVAGALNLDVAGVDILFDVNGYRVCEANSAPGFQGLEKACGISVPGEIFKVVQRSDSDSSRSSPQHARLRSASFPNSDAIAADTGDGLVDVTT